MLRKICFFLVIVIVSCNESVKGTNGVAYKTPIAYNDYIVSRQNELIKKIIQLAEVANTNLDSASRLLNKYELETTSLIKDVSGMPAYKGDSALRDAAISTFSFYKKMFNHDYRRLLELRMSGNAESEEEIAEMKSIVEKISRDEEKYDKTFHNTQQDFAAKNKMKLIENELQQKINKIKDE